MRTVLAIAAASISFGTSALAVDIQKAVFAGGCFWCVESDFEAVKGVRDVVSGFSGGSKADATYKKITKGGTGHYEVVQITFDADRISYETLVDMFFRSVDVTDAGGQFCDRGESYRTAIFAQNSAQAKTAEAVKARLSSQVSGGIVTPILAKKPFYPADAYHQDYYKSSTKILTRFGPLTKAKAYKRYREACGRDARVKQVWGNAAFGGS